MKKKVDTCPPTEHKGYFDIPIQVEESLGMPCFVRNGQDRKDRRTVSLDG